MGRAGGRRGRRGRTSQNGEGEREEQLRWSQSLMSDNLTATKATSNHGSSISLRSRSAQELKTNTRRDTVVHPRSLAGHRKHWCRGQLVGGSILSGGCLSLRLDERL